MSLRHLKIIAVNQMAMICNPIPFVKAGSKNFSWKL